jgi:hypothetical protein
VGRNARLFGCSAHECDLSARRTIAWTVDRDPKRHAYMDQALSSVGDDDEREDTLHLLGAEARAALVTISAALRSHRALILNNFRVRKQFSLGRSPRSSEPPAPGVRASFVTTYFVTISGRAIDTLMRPGDIRKGIHTVTLKTC